jgi:hypothetical protein
MNSPIFLVFFLFCFHFLLEDEDDEEILSTSTTGRLWKSAFHRRGAQQFLDICLLKKAYVKTLEDMVNEAQDREMISSLLNNIVERTADELDNEQNSNEISCTSQLKKRSLASNTKLERDDQQMKRLRHDSTPSKTSIR